MRMHVMKVVRFRALISTVCLLLFVITSQGNASGTGDQLKDIEKLFGKDWYGLYMMGQKLGYAATDLGRTEFHGEKGYKLNIQTHCEIAMFGVKANLDNDETRIYGADGKLRRLEFTMSQPMGAPVRFTGEVDSGKFRLAKKIADQEQVVLVEIPNETLRDALEEAAMIHENTKVGDSHESEVYQPLLDEKQTLHARSVVTAVEQTMYNGVPTRVFRVETTIVPLGITTVAKVSAGGETLEENFGGLTMRLEDEALAKDIKYAVDMVVSSAILTRRRIENPHTVTEMTARIGGIADENLIINDARQSYSAVQTAAEEQESRASSQETTVQSPKSWLLTVRKDNLDGVQPASVPMKPEEFGSALRPSVLVQSADTKIVQLARSIVGDEKNAFETTKKLNEWVYRNLKKDFTASLSNALDTLKQKSGDCTEHSVLLVALARAVGLPAREVAGVVYSDEGGGFFFHQWAEVYVGTWIATDPTFGQPIADATHIKLTEGDILKQMRIIGAIGRLKIEVVDYKK